MTFDKRIFDEVINPSCNDFDDNFNFKLYFIFKFNFKLYFIFCFNFFFRQPSSRLAEGEGHGRGRGFTSHELSFFLRKEQFFCFISLNNNNFWLCELTKNSTYLYGVTLLRKTIIWITNLKCSIKSTNVCVVNVNTHVCLFNETFMVLVVTSQLAFHISMINWISPKIIL